jgi:hypothetical protein
MQLLDQIAEEPVLHPIDAARSVEGLAQPDEPGAANDLAQRAQVVVGKLRIVPQERVHTRSDFGR